MKSFAAISVAAGLIIAGFFAFLHRQAIIDSLEGMAYKPSSDIQAIEERIGLTTTGVRIFHATAPEVVDAGVFNESCPRQEAASAIVGCYTSQDSIFIYNITNEALDGIKEVTAAHELLHAVWRRMDGAERERIGALLEEAYAKNGDAKLKERMEYYARTEKGQERNELHSILGTEIAALNPELEVHYARYFNRAAVVALYEKYYSQYESLENTVARIQQEMKTLEESVTVRSQLYDRESALLEADIQSFNSRASGGAFASQAQFMTERAGIMTRVRALDAQRAAINEDIERYNALHEEYEAAGREIQSLNTSLDSMKALERPAGVEQI